MNIRHNDPDFEEKIKDIVPLGEQWYETKIRALVEPEFHNHYVAIHVDSGDYEVAKSTAEASRALTKRRPEAMGRMMTRRIGDELDYGLIARVLAGEMMARDTK